MEKVITYNEIESDYEMKIQYNLQFYIKYGKIEGYLILDRDFRSKNN